jgi:uncharacterized protein YndB with AHSA1/START domain
MGVQRGCLLLADISGYTKYLTGVELDHSQDILADLLGTIVGHLTSQLELAKLEGDAVFCFSSDSAGNADGASLVTMVEGCYFAFEEGVRNIKNLTTCQCNACLRIPELTLKFLVHHGEYAIHDVLGNRELVGSDVILAHRLLKNEVTKTTGLRGYALFTQTGVERFGLDPSAIGWSEHRETYDDVGEVAAWLFDLEARWEEEQKRRRVYLAPGEALIDVSVDLPGPPAAVWEWFTSPNKRVLWQPGALRIDQENEGGARGIGTINHCVHGEATVREQILDWKPFDYLSYSSQGDMGTLLATVELVSLDDGTTRVGFRMHPEDPAMLEPMTPIAEQFTEMLREAIGKIATFLSEGVLTP